MEPIDIARKLLRLRAREQIVEELFDTTEEGLEEGKCWAIPEHDPMYGDNLFHSIVEYIYECRGEFNEYYSTVLSETPEGQEAAGRIEELVRRADVLIAEAEKIADEYGLEFCVRGGKEFFGENGPGKYDYNAGESYHGYWDPSTC